MKENQQLEDLFNSAAKTAGTSADDLKRTAAADPKLSSVLKGLSGEDLSKISAVLSDPQATARVMATPQAQEFLKKLKAAPRK